MNMLLVEDDERIVRFMRRGLEAESWTVFHVRNQQEYEHMRHHPINFVICDIFLGEENGLEICKHIRRYDPVTPILIVTAKDSPSLSNETIMAGANGYLNKPFSFDDLLTQIHKLITLNITKNDELKNGAHLSSSLFNKMERSFTS